MSIAKLVLCCLVLAALAATGHAAPAAKTLRAGASRLTLMPTPIQGWGVRLETGADGYAQTQPLQVQVVGADGAAQWLAGGYQTVTARAGSLVGRGTLITERGSAFEVTDTWRAVAADGAWTVARRVEVKTVGVGDVGFSSRLSLTDHQRLTFKDCDFFMPGVWYKDNAHVPPRALAAPPVDGTMPDVSVLIREDRLPLPLIAERDKRTGITLLLAHLSPDGGTLAGEAGRARIIDSRLQFGSLGVLRLGVLNMTPPGSQTPEVLFQFPGTEGDRTYIHGVDVPGEPGALRSHPVQVGVHHDYRLLLRIWHTASFPDAVRESWRLAYTQQAPPIAAVPLEKVRVDGLALLAAVCRPVHGVPDVPFAIRVPGGEIKDTSSQMGFVGQALPAAALLLGQAFEAKNADTQAQATQIVDFWAKNSLTPSGLPRTWYDIQADGTWTWRDYHTFLRVASDGADGALQAWNIARKHGVSHPEWLAFCRNYGDWLLTAQFADGSWAREYGFDGKPVLTTPAGGATDTTDQPIPFLVDLFLATGDARYRDAALRAGTFCLRSVNAAYAYVGGTPDNPNVLDKEGGMMALEAFLALHDLGGDPRWLRAACQAADYCETWVYGWNPPVPPGERRSKLPPGRRAESLSLIATGHSGADSYMAAAPFFFYRLYLKTDDAHYRDFARFLLPATKNLLDYDGTLGYKYPGLQTEALSLVMDRNGGVGEWLPWLTVVQLTPLTRLRSVFGTLDLDALDKRPLAARKAQNAAYARRRGF